MTTTLRLFGVHKSYEDQRGETTIGGRIAYRMEASATNIFVQRLPRANTGLTDISLLFLWDEQ